MLNNKRYVRMLTGLTALLLGLCGCAVPPETISAPSGVQAPVAPATVPGKPDAAADAGGAPVTLNLADFGAAGNGQADDTAALRNAVSAVLEAGGGTVYLPAGTYRLTDTLMLTGDDSAPLTLRADPTGQTVLAADASVNGPAVWIERSGVTLFGLDIILGTTEDQPAVLVTGSHVTLDSVTARMTAGNTQPGFLVYGSYDTLRNCGVGYVSDTQYMVVFSKMPGLDAVGNVLEDCHFGGMAGKCVLVTSEDDNGVPEQLTIRRNVFLVVGCDQVEVRAARNLYITDNMLDAAGVCVLLDPLPAGVRGVQITDNYCGASTGGARTGGVRTESAYGGTLENVIVSANYFWCPNAVRVVLPEYTGFSLTDNYFVLTGGDAVYMAAAVGAYMEGNVVANIGGQCPLRLEAVDEMTVIQGNAWGNGIEVPEWRTRFAAQNSM